MEHKTKITLLLLTMFLIAQLIGLTIVNFYLEDNEIPYGFDQKEQIEKTPNFYSQFLISLIFSLIFAILIVFFLTKIKSTIILKIWFFTVISLTLGITLNALLIKLNIVYPAILALIAGIILAYFKILKRNMIVHNLTELLIYPGIAAIFVLMLNLTTTIIILILISLYDVWAVWRSGIMQKMAKFQINNLGVLGGFLIPYASKEMKNKIKLLKMKYKNKISEAIAKKYKLKVNVALLGGGDIVFPIIAAGVMLKTFNSVWPALIVTFTATLALFLLFLSTKKGKAYPAMPYLTAGIFLGMLINWLIRSLI